MLTALLYVANKTGNPIAQKQNDSLIIMDPFGFAYCRTELLDGFLATLAVRGQTVGLGHVCLPYHMHVGLDGLSTGSTIHHKIQRDQL